LHARRRILAGRQEAKAMTAALEMIDVADPMCSWCYGFAPVIFALAERFEARLPLRLMMGGLRAGNTELMRAAEKHYVRQAWTQVGALAGRQGSRHGIGVRRCANG
jgi:protein-disulfide isomerase-like protein with CxxC motif